jgi:HK97 family phage portal protein
VRSLLATLSDRFEKRGADPTLPWGDSTPPTNGMLGSLTAGTNVTEQSAVGIAAVYTCVSILADAVSTLPLRQYRIMNGERTEMDPSPLVMQPFSEISVLDFLSQGIYSEALRGNAYGKIIARDNRGFATQIMLVHPDKVVVRREKGELVYRFGMEVVDPDDVFHVRHITPPGGLVGINPIEACRNAFGLSRAAELYQGSFYANSAVPNGALEVPGDLTVKEAREVAQLWNLQHQGIGQANNVAVLSAGVKWQQVTMNADDAQFIESRQFSRLEIGSIFRIPPHMMGDVDRTTSWGTGIEQQELGFVRSTLFGYLKRWEIALSDQLPRGQLVRFDLRERLRSDTLSRYQAHMIGRTGGWETIEQIIKDEGLPPLDPEYDDIAKNPMQPLNSAQNGTAPGVDPMPPDPGSQKSPSGQ